MLHLIEKKLTFKPTKEDHGGLESLRHERVRFGQDFGLELDGVFFRGTSDTVILFTHGNRHNITKFRDHYELFSTLGQSFFTFDYPGYGKSGGTPTEESVYASARAAHAYVQHSLGFRPEKIVAYGCSMGGAVAIELAQSAPIACLITESTFTNSWDMAKHLYPYFPVWPLLPKRFQNDTKLAHIKVPILLIHGEDDGVVPVTMASQLQEAATTKATLVLVPGANHVNSLSVGSESLKTIIRDFIREHTS